MVSRPEPQWPMRADCPAAGGAARPKILYVEDEFLVQALAVVILEDAGFVVEVASTGQEALLRLDGPGSRYRALITDVDLGPGPKGWDVADHARRKFPDMPVVYVSGGSAQDWGCLGVPGSTMLSKPYAPAQLVAAVSTAISATDAQASGEGRKACAP
jgi:CheY-like chemotaxis protein